MVKQQKLKEALANWSFSLFQLKKFSGQKHAVMLASGECKEKFKKKKEKKIIANFL